MVTGFQKDRVEERDFLYFFFFLSTWHFYDLDLEVRVLGAPGWLSRLGVQLLISDQVFISGS